MEDEEEVLLTIVDQLVGMIREVGGPQWAYTLYAPLEFVCHVEEDEVRKKAVEAIETISLQMSDSDVEEHLVPLIRKLHASEWFTAKMSGCTLIPVALSRCSRSTRAQLAEDFSIYGRGDSPMVRRSVFASLGAFAAAVGESELPMVLELLSNAIRDPADSVREVFFKTVVELKMVYPNPNNIFKLKDSKSGLTSSKFKDLKTNWKPSANAIQLVDEKLSAHLESFVYDTDYRVRRSLVEALPDIARHMPSIRSNLISNFLVPLLIDQEHEVRAMSADKTPMILAVVLQLSQPLPAFLENQDVPSLTPEPYIPSFTSNYTAVNPRTQSIALPQSSLDSSFVSDVLEKVVASFEKLLQDSQTSVRIATSVAIPEIYICTLAQSSNSITSRLHSIATTLLSDQSTDVRLRFIESCYKLGSLGFSRHLQLIVPTFDELLVDAHWRIRCLFTHCVGILATEQIKDESSLTRYRTALMNFLKDPVSAVRDAAIHVLGRCVAVALGDSWTLTKLVPVVMELMGSRNYLHRMAGIELLGVIGTVNVLSEPALNKVVVFTIMQMTSDVVPNVRFTAIETLEALSKNGHVSVKTIGSHILPLLGELIKNDKDTDVFDFTERAIVECKLAMNNNKH